MFPSLSHIDCLLSSTLYFFMESSFHERVFSDTFVLLHVSWDSLEQWWPDTSPSTSGLLAFYFHFWTWMRDFAHSPSEFSLRFFLPRLFPLMEDGASVRLIVSVRWTRRFAWFTLFFHGFSVCRLRNFLVIFSSVFDFVLYLLPLVNTDNAKWTR